MRCNWKFRHESNCSASLNKPRYAKQLSRVTEFSVCTKQPLWIRFLAFSFTVVFELGYALLYQFYAKINIFSIRNVRFGSALWHPEFMHEVILHHIPWYKTEISRMGENRAKTLSGMQEQTAPQRVVWSGSHDKNIVMKWQNVKILNREDK